MRYQCRRCGGNTYRLLGPDMTEPKDRSSTIPDVGLVVVDLKKSRKSLLRLHRRRFLRPSSREFRMSQSSGISRDRSQVAGPMKGKIIMETNCKISVAGVEENSRAKTIADIEQLVNISEKLAYRLSQPQMKDAAHHQQALNCSVGILNLSTPLSGAVGLPGPNILFAGP